MAATRLFIDGIATPFVNAFSGLGWLFLGIIWFGISSITVIFAVTMVLLPFAVINVRTGLEEADAEIEELGASLTRSRSLRILRITMPLLLPYLFATLRTSFGMAWKAALVSELFGATSGLGYLLQQAQTNADAAMVFACCLVIVLIFGTVDLLVLRPLAGRCSVNREGKR